MDADREAGAAFSTCKFGDVVVDGQFTSASVSGRVFQSSTPQLRPPFHRQYQHLFHNRSAIVPQLFQQPIID